MSKHKNRSKNKQRVICPACYDADSKNRIELIIKKVVVKWSTHPLLRKPDGLAVDFGLILEQASKTRLFYATCPKCGTSEKYDSLEELIEDIEPMVDYIASNGAFTGPIIQPKQIDKKIILPKIIKISEDDTVHKS